MKKMILSLGLLGLLSSAHADLVKVNVDGGYTTVTMKDFNDSLGAGSTGLNSGWYVGGEATLGIIPLLEIGPRVEYLQTNNASAGGYTAAANLTSGMLGVNTHFDLPLTGLGFGAGAFGGYGYATSKITPPAGAFSNGQLLTGGGFVGEIEARLSYSFLPLTSLFLNGAFRFANVGTLSDGNSSSPTAYDFSGVNLGGGLSIGF
jgi:hypothetical protein